MNTLAMLGLFWLFQMPAEAPATTDIQIWEEITLLENQIKDSISEEGGDFGISRSDPVRGYYIERVGVVFLVPLRHRPAMRSALKENASLSTVSDDGLRLEKQEIVKRVREWQEELKKEEMLKEANFEKVVAFLKGQIPVILKKLTQLQGSESLTLVLEERLPAWYFAAFSLKKDPTRKIVTLTVDKDLISDIHSRKTVLSGEWLDRIKQTTTNRRVAPAFP